MAWPRIGLVDKLRLHPQQTTPMTKPRLYFIPGTQCDERVWQKLWPKLSDFELIHLPIPNGANVDELASKIAAEIKEEQVSLIGFSLGGHLAARLAQLAPEKVGRLFLIANSPCPLPEEELSYRAGTLKWIAEHGYTGIGRGRLRKLIDPANWDQADIQACIKSMDSDLGAAVLVAQLEATTQRDGLLEGFRQLQTPVTLCFGESDYLIDHHYLNRNCAQNHRLKQIEVPSCGHMMPLEQAGQTAERIKTWAMASR